MVIITSGPRRRRRRTAAAHSLPPSLTTTRLRRRRQSNYLRFDRLVLISIHKQRDKIERSLAIIMSSIMSSQGVVLATAMAVSGTVILLALRLQKPPPTAHFSIPPSCIISSSDEGKKKEKRKKKVHFAEDVVDPSGNSEEYRKLHKTNINKCPTLKKGRKLQEMPANRVALYNGILRDRVIHKVAYSC